MRLIDADALSQKWQDVLEAKADEKDSIAYQTFELFIERLKDEPTIDAEPVRHGRWMKYTSDSGIYCSECHKKRRYKDIRDDYCPKCGAKMDGGDEE